MCGRPHRAERLLVVHPHRAEQGHGPERPGGQAVGGADERKVAQRRVVELGPDAHERPPGVERLADDLEQRRPLLQHLDQALVGVELLGPEILEQPRRPSDVEALFLGDECLGE